MRVDAVVTMEFMIDVPLTWRGEVEAASAQSCARDAIKQAKEMYPRKKWASMVILLAQKGVLSGELHEVEAEEENADEGSR